MSMNIHLPQTPVPVDQIIIPIPMWIAGIFLIGFGAFLWLMALWGLIAGIRDMQKGKNQLKAVTVMAILMFSLGLFFLGLGLWATDLLPAISPVLVGISVVLIVVAYFVRTSAKRDFKEGIPEEFQWYPDVECLKCGWLGDFPELKDGKCPMCGGLTIEKQRNTQNTRRNTARVNN